MPLEVALGAQDPAAFLLLALGADADLETHSSFRSPWNAQQRYALLDYARVVVAHVRKSLAKLDAPASQTDNESELPLPSAEMATWADYFAAHNAEIKRWTVSRSTPNASRSDEMNESEDQNALKRAQLQVQDAYWTEVRDALEARKAKTWNELHPDRPREEAAAANDAGRDADKPSHGYARCDGRGRRKELVAVHLVPLYDALYQACWDGDDARVKELCTPDEARPEKPVLGVAVEANRDGNQCMSCGPASLKRGC
jgi:hypothetical protein